MNRWPRATSPITQLIIDTSAFLFVFLCGRTIVCVMPNGFLTFIGVDLGWAAGLYCARWDCSDLQIIGYKILLLLMCFK